MAEYIELVKAQPWYWAAIFWVTLLALKMMLEEWKRLGETLQQRKFNRVMWEFEVDELLDDFNEEMIEHTCDVCGKVYTDGPTCPDCLAWADAMEPSLMDDLMAIYSDIQDVKALLSDSLRLLRKEQSRLCRVSYC